MRAIKRGKIKTNRQYNLLIGYDKTAKWKKVLLDLPGVISVLLTTVGIGELHYIKGATTWYSMGFSVYICYGTLVLYYGAILYIVASRRRFLESGKILETLTCIVIAGVILAIQICFPEVLLTAVFPTILLLGIYIGSENPSIRQLEMRSFGRLHMRSPDFIMKNTTAEGIRMDWQVDIVWDRNRRKLWEAKVEY